MVPCLAFRLYDTEIHNVAKTQNFYELKSDLKKIEEKKEIVLFGRLKNGIKGSQKQHVWKEITIAVNCVGMGN